jgi:DNA polymerase III delta prime subunit
MEILKGQSMQPPRLLVYGPPGVGKTSFAAGAPGCVIVQTEEGADVVGADRFPLATSVDDVWHALDQLEKEKSRLTRLRARGMAIVLIGHSQVKRFEAPDMEAFDRYEIKLHKKAGDLCTEFCDLVGFATLRMTTREETSAFGQKKVKAVGSGERVLRTASRPSYVAKSRYSIAEELPLEWAALINAIAGDK